jgi:hypothetical protein
MSNNCDILGDGKKDQECDCSQDNLFEKAEQIFTEKNFEKLGKFALEMIDNCVGNPVAKKPKAKRAPSAYNIFMSEYMKGCGKDGADSCKETMSKGAAAWQKKKKQEGK